MSQEKNEFDLELESGKYLFKYCKFDVNVLQIIINKTLYFSAPDKLNDPLDSDFELRIKNPENFSETTLDIIRYSGFAFREELRAFLKKPSSSMINRERLKILLEEFFNYMQDTYLGICSFSTKKNSSNLLWSHYANEAKGLCLVFDREQLIQSLTENDTTGIRFFNDSINYDGIKPIEVDIKDDGGFSYTFAHLFFKTQHWSDEKEFRIIKKSYVTGSSDFEFIRFFPFSRFDDKCLKFIITGERILEEHLHMLEQLKANKSISAKILGHKFDR